jgi:hypothetical protein
MMAGISDIMEDMEVSIICQQLYRAYVHTILIGIVINIMPSYPTTYSLIVYFADVCIYIHDHLGFCLGFVDTLNSVSPEKTLFQVY